MVLREQLSRSALHKALKLRRDYGIAVNQVFDVFDFTTTCGLEVRFVDIPSFEAMYVQDDQPRILLSSHRPMARQAFSCAHELGHHIFGHGSRIDNYIDSEADERRFESQEFIADRFASFLLMPKTLVAHAFHTRGWTIEACSPTQLFTIAGWLGVGYTTLIYQMAMSLNLFTRRDAEALLHFTPKEIREDLFVQSVMGNVIVVDAHWKDRAIDVQVGDHIRLPTDIEYEGSSLAPLPDHEEGAIYEASSPGVGRFLHSASEWCSYVRVSRRGYVGRSIFRHLEDPEHE